MDSIADIYFFGMANEYNCPAKFYDGSYFLCGTNILTAN